MMLLTWCLQRQLLLTWVPAAAATADAGDAGEPLLPAGGSTGVESLMNDRDLFKSMGVGDFNGMHVRPGEECVVVAAAGLQAVYSWGACFSDRACPCPYRAGQSRVMPLGCVVAPSSLV